MKTNTLTQVTHPLLHRRGFLFTGLADGCRCLLLRCELACQVLHTIAQPGFMLATRGRRTRRAPGAGCRMAVTGASGGSLGRYIVTAGLSGRLQRGVAKWSAMARAQ